MAEPYPRWVGIGAAVDPATVHLNGFDVLSYIHKTRVDAVHHQIVRRLATCYRLRRGSNAAMSVLASQVVCWDVCGDYPLYTGVRPHTSPRDHISM